MVFEKRGLVAKCFHRENDQLSKVSQLNMKHTQGVRHCNCSPILQKKLGKRVCKLCIVNSQHNTEQGLRLDHLLEQYRERAVS